MLNPALGAEMLGFGGLLKPGFKTLVGDVAVMIYHKL